MAKWNEGMTDRQWVLLYGDVAKRKGRPLFLCRERRAGWSAKLPIYMLWCDRCADHTVAHPAGYGRIHCKNRHCRTMARVMTWRRFRDQWSMPIMCIALLVLSLWTLVTLVRR